MAGPAHTPGHTATQGQEKTPCTRYTPESQAADVKTAGTCKQARAHTCTDACPLSPASSARNSGVGITKSQRAPKHSEQAPSRPSPRRPSPPIRDPQVVPTALPHAAGMDHQSSKDVRALGLRGEHLAQQVRDACDPESPLVPGGDSSCGRGRCLSTREAAVCRGTGPLWPGGSGAHIATTGYIGLSFLPVPYQRSSQPTGAALDTATGASPVWCCGPQSR